MNKNFSDKQLDQILQKIVKDSALDEETINEIADSPQIWWKVQSGIKRQKSREKAWIPTWMDWRIAVFASVVFVFLSGLFLFSKSGENDLKAQQNPPEKFVAETPDFAQTLNKTESNFDKNASKDKNSETFSENFNSKNNLKKQNSVSTKRVLKTSVLSKSRETNAVSKNSPKTEVKTKKTEEIKTDFIALAYTFEPESGQILKVKVPRSMMVSLGVANNVENSSELVNAEVLMGDDGLARAIRFTRESEGK